MLNLGARARSHNMISVISSVPNCSMAMTMCLVMHAFNEIMFCRTVLVALGTKAKNFSASEVSESICTKMRSLKVEDTSSEVLFVFLSPLSNNWISSARSFERNGRTCSRNASLSNSIACSAVAISVSSNPGPSDKLITRCPTEHGMSKG